MGNTINLAEKYAKAVQERFYKDSITSSSMSKDLDMEFTGVKTVKVYDVDTAKLNDYERSGSNRYGTPEELTDNVQEFVMTQDKAFTFTIDKGNAKEQFNIKRAGQALKREMREVVTPFIDKYRLRVWAENAGKAVAIATVTKSTIADAIMDGTAALDDALVPEEGRTLYIKTTLYKTLKLCDQYVALEKTGHAALVRGQVGEFDNMPVVKVPSSLMPAGAQFMIIHKSVPISPVKLNEYKIHKNPPGISGDLVEGRVLFDAFVKGTRVDGIYVAVETGLVVAAPTITVATGAATLASTTTGASIKFTTDGSDPRYSAAAQIYNSAAKPAMASGNVVRAVAFKDGMYRSDVTEVVVA